MIQSGFERPHELRVHPLREVFVHDQRFSWIDGAEFDAEDGAQLLHLILSSPTTPLRAFCISPARNTMEPGFRRSLTGIMTGVYTAPTIRARHEGMREPKWNWPGEQRIAENQALVAVIIDRIEAHHRENGVNQHPAWQAGIDCGRELTPGYARLPAEGLVRGVSNADHHRRIRREKGVHMVRMFMALVVMGLAFAAGSMLP